MLHYDSPYSICSILKLYVVRTTSPNYRLSSKLTSLVADCSNSADGVAVAEYRISTALTQEYSTCLLIIHRLCE